MAQVTKLLVGVAAVVLTLLCLNTVFSLLNSRADGTLSTTLCNDSNPCTADFDHGDGTCTHRDYNTAHTCTDACYTNGQCNGGGACTGDVSTCFGACTNNCDAQFVFNPAWTATCITPFDNIPVVWVETQVCFVGMCVAFTVDAYAGAFFGPEPIYLASLAQCKDYLDVDFWAAHGACITTERHLLDMNMTRFQAQSTNFDHFFGPFFNDPDILVQFSVCSYYYKCGQLNATEIGLIFTSLNAAVAAQTVWEGGDNQSKLIATC